MRVLITRPIEDAKPLADALSESGIDVQIEPLLEVTPLDDAEIDLDNVQALLFTSANGVRAFAGLNPRRDLKTFTVGDGSAEAARRAGFAQVESAKGDIEALTALVVDRLKPEDGVLFHAAGTVTAGDLKSRLEGLGFQVRRAQLYDAKIATQLSTETRANLTLGGIDAILLFSPRTARTFAELWRGAGSPSLGNIFAICLSAAVAREIDTLGWAGVDIADRPDLPSMLALVDAAERKVAERGASMADTETRAADTAAGGIAGNAGGGADTSAPQPAVAPAPRRGRAGPALYYLILSAVAAALVVIAAPFWQPLVNGMLGLQQSTAPIGDDRVAALQSEVQALAAKVDEAADQAAVSEAIAAVVDPLATEIATAKQELTDIRGEIDNLKRYLPSAAISTETLPAAPGVDLTPLENRVSTLQTALDETTRRLNDLTAAQGTAQGTAPATPAEPQAAAPDPRVDALSIENQALRDQIATLTQRLDQLGDLESKLQEMEPRLGALSDQVANLPRGVEQQRAAALIVAIGELRSALASDKGFTAELSALEDLTRADDAMRPRLKPLLDALAPLAESGVPTLSQLAAGFPATEIARAGEAQLGAEMTDDAWYKRLWSGTVHALSEVFTLRPVGPDVEGDGTLARLARAEAKLGEGDLSGAVTEVKGLQGLAAETAAEWLSQAEARLTIEQAAAQLADLSTRELAPQAGDSGAAQPAPDSSQDPTLGTEN
jgi:uroporphyrinogen-III synthase